MSPSRVPRIFSVAASAVHASAAHEGAFCFAFVLAAYSPRLSTEGATLTRPNLWRPSSCRGCDEPRLHADRHFSLGIRDAHRAACLRPCDARLRTPSIDRIPGSSPRQHPRDPVLPFARVCSAPFHAMDRSCARHGALARFHLAIAPPPRLLADSVNAKDTSSRLLQTSKLRVHSSDRRCSRAAVLFSAGATASG